MDVFIKGKENKKTIMRTSIIYIILLIHVYAFDKIC